MVHIAIYYICNIPFIEIQENTVSNEMAGVTVFLNYDNSLQQNKNTMFDDKEQVFCEEKKNGLLFTGWFTGCVTETLPRME